MRLISGLSRAYALHGAAVSVTGAPPFSGDGFRTVGHIRVPLVRAWARGTAGIQSDTVFLEVKFRD